MIPQLAIGAAAAAAAAYLYLRAPGRSLESALQDVQGMLVGSISLNAAQQQMAAVISQVATDEGYGWLVPAMIANAYAESRLDPLAAGDGGASIGLFQLHERGGGVGLSRKDREDPVINTVRIIDEAIAAGADSWRGYTNAELAALFAQKVERCAECGVKPGDSTKQLTYRSELVTKLFGAALAVQVPR